MSLPDSVTEAFFDFVEIVVFIKVVTLFSLAWIFPRLIHERKIDKLISLRCNMDLSNSLHEFVKDCDIHYQRHAMYFLPFAKQS